MSVLTYFNPFITYQTLQSSFNYTLVSLSISSYIKCKYLNIQMASNFNFLEIFFIILWFGKDILRAILQAGKFLVQNIAKTLIQSCLGKIFFKVWNFVTDQ